jgi:NitT/TauT family transport system permease protein
MISAPTSGRGSVTRRPRALRVALPVLTGLAALAAWWTACTVDVFPTGTVPPPAEVAAAFVQELRSSRLLVHAIASLYRVAWGFLAAGLTAVPLGLVLGRSAMARAALLPWINFSRSLSPIAWVPFAIVWFGLGDPPAIFIIFLATFFQIALATTAAAGSVPSVYYRVAEDLELAPREVLFRITLPAIMPQLVTALRVAIGVAWMVVVAAEMIARDSGLGYLILDARSGLRMDLVVVAMITIGTIGIALDIAFAGLAKLDSVRWGFER